MAKAHPYLDYSIQLVKLGNWFCGLGVTIRIIHHKTQHVDIKHGQSRLGRAEKSMSVFETEKENLGLGRHKRDSFFQSQDSLEFFRSNQNQIH